MVPRRVLLVAMPTSEGLDVVGPLDVLHVANQALARAGSRDSGYAVDVVAGVRTVSRWTGLRLLADRPYSSLRGPVDTLIVCAIDPELDPGRDPAFINWLARTAPRARRVVGLCSASFALAEAGLLDGRSATTHWAYCDDLARRYPRVTVQRDPIYVRDGPIWTSAGSTAALDLTLALVEEDLGRQVALTVARTMVLFLKRPGGQAQFSVQLSTQLAEREPIRDLQAWIVEHPGADLSVDALARRASMSARNFSRVFVREVGMTPGRFVERVRVEAGRRLLEETSRALPQVAAACGFGSIETMRVAFRRTLRVNPKAYRSRFTRVDEPRLAARAR